MQGKAKRRIYGSDLWLFEFFFGSFLMLFFCDQQVHSKGEGILFSFSFRRYHHVCPNA